MDERAKVLLRKQMAEGEFAHPFHQRGVGVSVRGRNRRQLRHVFQMRRRSEVKHN